MKKVLFAIVASLLMVNFGYSQDAKKALKSADAIGCFYVESPAMRMLLKKLQVDNYLGLVAASSSTYMCSHHNAVLPAQSRVSSPAPRCRCPRREPGIVVVR